MKTTVNLPPSLVAKAKRHALEHGITLREIIERGIQLIISNNESLKKFKLRDGSVAGNGLQSKMSLGDWDSVRNEIYKGRGA